MKRLGLTKNRMRNEEKGKPDALFFWNLVFPFCNTKNNGISDDPRKVFYFPVASYSNIYKHQKGSFLCLLGAKMSWARKFENIMVNSKCHCRSEHNLFEKEWNRYHNNYNFNHRLSDPCILQRKFLLLLLCS